MPYRCNPVPEGGELCLTACVVTEGNGTCGKSKPPQPSPKGANNRQLFALFEDDVICSIYTASSASLHMRLSKVGPLRGPMYVIAFTPKLRMNHLSHRRLPSFVAQLILSPPLGEVGRGLRGGWEGASLIKLPPFGRVGVGVRWCRGGCQVSVCVFFFLKYSYPMRHLRQSLRSQYSRLSCINA